MANEITMNASLGYVDSELASLILAIPQNLQKTITTKRYVLNRLVVTTAELAIPLGNLSSLGYYLFINRDPTNYVELRVSTGGVKFARLDPVNGFACGRFGSGISAPFAIANTASCDVDYFILAP